MIEVVKRPQLVVLSAPSGGGKTTICRMLSEKNPDFRLSISATTRPPRANEKDGVHYYFLSEEEFLDKVKRGEFLEYEKVHGNYYGTLKSKLKEILEAGHTVLFDIDVYGALNIKKHYPKSILIFIRPPSLAELKRRLRKRHTDDESEIEKRLQRLPEEYARAVYFDYDIINNDLNETVERIQKIIRNHQEQDKYVTDKSI